MKQIPGFPDYCITKDGCIWSKPKQGSGGHSGKWLRLNTSDRGYKHIELSKNKKPFYKRVHRLVLETYIGPCPEGMECRHLNGDPADNRLENLEWATHIKNEQDKVKHKTTLRGERHHQVKLKESDIKVIQYLRKTAKFTLTIIAWHFNVTETTVWDICKRRTWRHI